MSINFEALKMGFKAYLESLEKESGSSSNKSEVADVSDVSIFMHAKEFKEYVSDELNVDISDIPMEFSELMNMEIVNGKLVEKGNSQDKNTNGNLESDIKNGEDEIISDLLNDLLKDSEVIKGIDKDGDNAVNTEEVTNFFKFISENDKNSDDISLEDIFMGIEQLKKGEYDPTKIETSEEEKIEETETPKEIKSSSGSSGGSGGSYNYNSSNNTNKTEVKEKAYEDMTLDELSNLKTDYQTKKEETKGLINDVHSGANAVVKSAQESLDEKKSAYDEAVKNDEKISNELKAERDENLNSISDKESSISNLKISINDKNNAIYDTTSQITAKNSELSALNSITAVPFVCPVIKPSTSDSPSHNTR